MNKYLLYILMFMIGGVLSKAYLFDTFYIFTLHIQFKNTLHAYIRPITIDAIWYPSF